MKFEFNSNRSLEVGPEVSLFGRVLRVVSEKLVVQSSQGRLSAIMISPIYLVFFEPGASYVYSVQEGVWIDLEQLYSANPDLKNLFS